MATPSPLAAPAPTETLSELRASKSFWQDAWARFKKDRISLLALYVFAALCAIALAAPMISEWNGYDPNKINLREDYQAPNAKHWFGTDEYGRDYFTRIVWAGRVSISIGFLIAFIEVTIGVVLGLVAGYFGGVIDDVLQAVVNLVSSIPFLPLLIILGSLFPLDPLTLALLVSALGWTGELRLVRGQVLAVKQRDYIVAARAIGSTDRRVMFQHVLPNVFSIVLVVLGFDIAGGIGIESGLSFLGFGVRPPTPTWGNMLSNSLAYATRNPWLVFYPGLAISVTILALFLLADGVRDATDPRLRNR